MTEYKSTIGMTPIEWNEHAKVTPGMGYWQEWRTQYLHHLYETEYGRLPVAKYSLLQRAITLQVACEYADALHLAGRGFDSEAYARSTTVMLRLFTSLGLEKKAEQPNDLKAFLDRRAALKLVKKGEPPVTTAPIEHGVDLYPGKD
ncbi:hypothetical protein LJR220_003058 [Bradyrhizobium sp. LjRoot220]|uniref:hypothetical protein n=1 Tax=Bradyrhizobium sp. LjRoot220 TaxID=3342284 RepID=UPI003ECC2F25